MHQVYWVMTKGLSNEEESVNHTGDKNDFFRFIIFYSYVTLVHL